MKITMDTKIRKVLMIGVDRDFQPRFESLLNDAGFDVDVLGSSESAMAIAQSIALDILVFGFPLANPTMSECLKKIREENSPCRRSAVLVVAAPDTVDEAREIKDSGYLRILSTDFSDPELNNEIDGLTRFAPRLSVRIPIRLEVHLGTEKAMVLSQTENVSACGMLVKAWRQLEEDSKLNFELYVPGEKQSIKGCGAVVRHTFDGMGKVRGVGIRFDEFSKDGFNVIRNYLRHHNQS